MTSMARERNEGRNFTPKESDPGFKLIREDGRRNIMNVTPPEAMVRLARKAALERGEEPPDAIQLLKALQESKLRDPLVSSAV